MSHQLTVTRTPTGSAGRCTCGWTETSTRLPSKGGRLQLRDMHTVDVGVRPEITRG